MSPQPAISSIAATAVDPAGYLLDVREISEWLAGHVAGSVHIPMNELPARLAEVPADQPIVVICRVGGRSAQVTAWLAAQGYDAVNLSGGLIDWAAKALPLTTAGGTPGIVV